MATISFSQVNVMVPLISMGFKFFHSRSYASYRQCSCSKTKSKTVAGVQVPRERPI
jgi:hypothetical protein